MVAHMTPFDPQFQRQLHMMAGALGRYGGPVVGQRQAYQLSGNILMQQAALWGYVDTFRVLTLLCLLAVGVVWLFRKTRPHGGPMAAH